jgi:hypothetical protein
MRVTLVDRILTDRVVKRAGLVAHDSSFSVCKQTCQLRQLEQNSHDGLTLEDENIVHGPYFVKHPWFPALTTPEKYTARAITEYMDLNIAFQHPRLERLLEQGMQTVSDWFTREVYVEVGVLCESKTTLTGEVAEVPKNVVQHGIGIIAAAAATAAAATTLTLAPVAAVAAAEFLWRRNQIQARLGYWLMVHWHSRRTMVALVVEPRQGRVSQM